MPAVKSIDSSTVHSWFSRRVWNENAKTKIEQKKIVCRLKIQNVILKTAPIVISRRQIQIAAS